VSVAADQGSGALVLAGLDVAHDAVELELGYLGTLKGLLAERVTDLEGLDVGLELLHELVVDGSLDVDAGTGAAALAVVEEEAKGGPANGVVEVGVVKDNVGRLATELEGDLLEVGAGGSLEDGPAGEGGAGESDLFDLHVL
jgi:hypothetical protein